MARTEERTLTDVAIIGAGPAGSTLAALLAMRGIGVVLLDRDSFPRDKVCGEFLSWDALTILERLGAMNEIDGAGAPRIGRCRIVGTHRTYEFPFPHEARGVSRMFLDDLLLRTAEKHGAKKMDGTAATSLTSTRVNDIDARVVVGAWGRWGRFDQQLGRAFVRDRRHRSFGFKRHYREVRPDPSVTPSVDLYSFDRGYLGVNAVEGGMVNICGLAHASRLSGHKGRWETFVDALRHEEPQLESLYAAHEPAQPSFLTSEPVIFRARSPVEGGVFMIGDASGVIDPLTGNGMAMAIQSALLVAPFLLELLENPSRRERVEQRYRDAHRRFFASRIAWSRRAALFLSRPRLLDSMLAVVPVPAAGDFLVRRTRAADGGVERLLAAWFH